MGFNSMLDGRRQRNRVVISGAGIITPLGYGWSKNSNGFRAGRNALSLVTLFDVSRQKAKVAGQVNLPESLPENRLTLRNKKRIDRAGAMLLLAGSEAFHASGWDFAKMDKLIPICLGTSAGSMELGEDYYRVAIEGTTRRQQAERISGYQTHRQGMQLCEAFGINASLTIISNACSSGANAIGHAFRLIQRGHARRAVAGGYDALCKMVFAGFDSLNALSTTSPRPFAADRDGLGLGEGAAIFCLERMDDALKRGAHIYAEIGGYAAATDRHHLTQPHPEGVSAYSTMNHSCIEACVNPADVAYLNSHGTGTPLNDSAEGRAICHWAGNAVQELRVSSTKGNIGHLLGGAGAVESAICLMAMEGRWIPPGVSVANPDPVCDFDLVQSPREVSSLPVTLTNSFGFGGSNASLVFKLATS